MPAPGAMNRATAAAAKSHLRIGTSSHPEPMLPGTRDWRERYHSERSGGSQKAAHPAFRERAPRSSADAGSVSHRRSRSIDSRNNRSPVRHQIGEREAVALDGLADRDLDRAIEHRARRHAGVKLAVLAARID